MQSSNRSWDPASDCQNLIDEKVGHRNVAVIVAAAVGDDDVVDAGATSDCAVGMVVIVSASAVDVVAGAEVGDDHDWHYLMQYFDHMHQV